MTIRWITLALVMCSPAFSQCTKLVLNPVTHKLDCNDGGGGSTAFQTNGVALSSATTVNFLNSATFFGLTGTFSNPSAGGVQFSFGGGPLTLGGGGTNATTAPGALLSLFPSPTRKGDVMYFDGTNWSLLAGNNAGNPCLSEDATGTPSWASCGAGSTVASFNGRTGTVVPASADYTAAQVTSAVDKTAANTYSGGGLQDMVAMNLRIPASAGFTSTVNNSIGRDTTPSLVHFWVNSADGLMIWSPVVTAPTTNDCAKWGANFSLVDSGAVCTSFYQLVGVGGTSQTARGRLNLIAGTNTTITPADNSGSNSTDVTIASTAGGNMNSTSGAGAPAGSCTAATDTYTDTTNHDLWFCSATNTWKKVLSTANTGAFVIVGATGTQPTTPAAGFVSPWLSTATNTLHSVNSSGVDTDYGNVACSNCVVASSPGAGIAHFAGSTQTVTSSAVVEADITTADNTTDNVGTSKHGFAPKSPNDATKYLDGTGAYSSPVKSGGFAASFGSVAAGASALVADIAYLTIPYACTISAWNINVNAGTATFDIWKISTGTAIPTVTNTITASALPAIASGTSVHSTTLTGWTTAVSANDIIAIQLKTVATATSAYLGAQCDH